MKNEVSERENRLRIWSRVFFHCWNQMIESLSFVLVEDILELSLLTFVLIVRWEELLFYINLVPSLDFLKALYDSILVLFFWFDYYYSFELSQQHNIPFYQVFESLKQNFLFDISSDRRRVIIYLSNCVLRI